MPGTLSKSEIFRALDDLPDEEIAPEDVIERLLLLKKVRSGFDQAGEGIPHEEVKQQFEFGQSVASVTPQRLAT